MAIRKAWLLLLFLAVFQTGFAETLAIKKEAAAVTKSKTKPKSGARHSVHSPGPSNYRDCSDCPEMVIIPGGSFMMGATASEEESQEYEKPRHEVKVNRFAMGKYEVSKLQFSEFVDATSYKAGKECWTMEEGKGEIRGDRNWSMPAFIQDNNHPVTCISVDDAEAYIKWLNQKTGKHYRVPTEAEWEYAARAGSDTARFWGDDANGACECANVADLSLQRSGSKVTPHNCDDGYTFTSPVGTYRANAFGLYDMLGNVWEWTCSADTGYGSHEEEKCTDVLSRRVYRGGSWLNVSGYVRSAARYGYVPAFRFFNVGFRLAQDL